MDLEGTKQLEIKLGQFFNEYDNDDNPSINLKHRSIIIMLDVIHMIKTNYELVTIK